MGHNWAFVYCHFSWSKRCNWELKRSFCFSELAQNFMNLIINAVLGKRQPAPPTRQTLMQISKQNVVRIYHSYSQIFTELLRFCLSAISSIWSEKRKPFLSSLLALCLNFKVIVCDERMSGVCICVISCN